MKICERIAGSWKSIHRRSVFAQPHHELVVNLWQCLPMQVTNVPTNHLQIEPECCNLLPKLKWSKGVTCSWSWFQDFIEFREKHTFFGMAWAFRSRHGLTQSRQQLFHWTFLDAREARIKQGSRGSLKKIWAPEFHLKLSCFCPSCMMWMHLFAWWTRPSSLLTTLSWTRSKKFWNAQCSSQFIGNQNSGHR